jgi:linoleoyl-CoA desaturase
MLGSANFEGGKLLHVMSGQLGYQIEHHLFPDLPSNRYAEISVKVKDICQRYGIPYTTGPLRKQYGQTLRTIMKLSLPNRRTKDNPAPPAPRTRRLRDDERPGRRGELGRWTNAAAAT